MSATLTFGASEAFTVNLFNLRRGWVGGRYARTWRAWTEGGSLRVVSFRQGGSGADPRDWDDRLAGATHAEADLGSGDVTADDVAAAFVTAAATLGSTWVRTGAQATNALASGIIAPPMRTVDEAEAGMFGMQRDAFGDGSTTNGAMGGIGSQHIAWNGGDARVIAIYFRSQGGNDVRVFMADGPAYAANPTAFSNIVQGVITAHANNALRVMVPTQPKALANGNYWLGHKAVASQELRFRDESNPLGAASLGDFATAGTLVYDNTQGGDPSVVIPANYDPTNSANYDLVSHIGFAVEVADSNGRYRSTEYIETDIGWRGADPTEQISGQVAPTRTDPTDMVDEAIAMRFTTPNLQGMRITRIGIGVGNWSAQEDFGGAVYQWPDLTIPSAGTPTLLRSLGALGTIAANTWNYHTPATPIDIPANTIVALHLNCGNRSGSGIPTTLQLLFDENLGSSNQYLSAWVGARNRWSDWVPEGGGGHGSQAEYQKRVSLDPATPGGNPNIAWPANYPIHASDASPQNNPRVQLRVVSDSRITASEGTTHALAGSSIGEGFGSADLTLEEYLVGTLTVEIRDVD